MRKRADGAQRHPLCDDADRPRKVLSKAVCESFARGTPQIVLGWVAIGHQKALLSQARSAHSLTCKGATVNRCRFLLRLATVTRIDPTTTRLPSEQQVRLGLAALVRGGTGALWGGETQALFEIPAVRSRIPVVSDDEAPQVVREVLEVGIERLGSPEYRDLLKVVLGLDPAASGLSARERREMAGRQFRGGTGPVAWGTIRQYHEPRALDHLAATLLAIDVEVGPVELERAPVPQPLENQRTCFVIGPIGNSLAEVGSPERQTWEESLRVMAEVIEPACAHHGLTPVRVDSLARAGEITGQIFRRLRDDDIVIADLTGANPNVMYELGLRHTRDKLTVQIGEYGRLPFDINTIRTIQFSQSPMGLINAREELIRVLEKGVSGDYDPVTATSVWNDTLPPHEVVAGGDAADDAAPTQDGDDASEQGFLDVMAEAEEQQEKLAPALEEVGKCVGELGQLSEKSTDQMRRSDAAGKGMRGRLQIITSYAAGVGAIAERLDAAVDYYVSVLNPFSAGTIALIQRMESDPDARDEGHDYGMIARRTAAVTRESMASLAGLVESIGSNASASRVLRAPSLRLTAALDRFVDATSVIDEWDRRLQALGIPMPPADWTPASDEGETTQGRDGTGNSDGMGAVSAGSDGDTA
jgi:hypothetical protein